MTIQQILENEYPPEIVEHVIKAYREMLQAYRLEKWKPSELDAGHFVEAVRRLLENCLFGSYTGFDSSLGSFSPAILNRYESATGDESYRIIPRVLYGMYCIRNKRGVGHIAAISPNKMDATGIVYSAKWVLAELIRIAGQAQPEEAHRLTDAILDRQVDLIWEDGETFMILDKSLKAQDRILVTLYKKDYLSVEELRGKVVYTNKTNFRKIILKLRSEKLIDLTEADICKLSPLGVQKAEKIVNEA